MSIFWILAPIFVAVGVYLLWYSRRSRRLVQEFARARSLRYRPNDDGQLAAALDAALSLEQPGLVRSFGQIRDIVSDKDSVILFRTVELLDLSPYGSSTTPHHSRVAVTYDVAQGHDLFALVSPDLHCQSMLGSESGATAKVVAILQGVLKERPPRCPLSVTLKRGRGLIYLEPRVTGSVRPEDLEYLIATARSLRAAFA
jgi:hypothetical protein